MGWLRNITMLALALILSGCAATKQARDVERSGFLKDLYPLMQDGEKYEALLVYRNPKVAAIPRGTYTKFMLDPVLVFRGAEAKMKGVPQEQAQAIADTFYALIYQELSKDYEMVTKPGPNTLRGQVAITNLDESYPALDVISTIPAPMNVLAMGSLLKNVTTGKPGFVGEAAIETKITDAVTGGVLGAAVDRRVGKKQLSPESFNSWDDVYQALRYWAEQARWRLCMERGQRTDCPRPKA